MSESFDSNRDTTSDGIGCFTALGLALLVGLIVGAFGLFRAWPSMAGTGIELIFLAALAFSVYITWFTLHYPVVMLYTKFRVSRGKRYIQKCFGSLDIRIDKRQVFLGEHLKGQIVVDRLDGPPFSVKLTLIAKRFSYLGYSVGGQIPRWKHEVVWSDTVQVESSDAVGKVVLKIPFSILVNVPANQMRGDGMAGRQLSLTRLHPFKLQISVPNLPTITLYPGISIYERSQS